MSKNSYLLEECCIVFIDTEFTNLEIQNGAPPELISLGATCLQGNHEFYLEMEHWNAGSVGAFTKENVLPILWRKEYKKEFKKFIGLWQEYLASFNKPVVLAMDSVWDWAWVISLAAGERHINKQLFDVFEPYFPYWSHNVSPTWLHLQFKNLSPELKCIEMEQRQEHKKIFQSHHALWDAQCNQKIIKKIIERAQVASTHQLKEKMQGSAQTVSPQAQWLGLGW